MPGPLTWTAWLLGAAWFLWSAKVHGRQVRLERELEGYTEVAFGREAQNPPWVEALWRADRVRYWPTVAGLVVLVFLVAFFAPREWRPFEELGALHAGLSMAFLWAPSLAFLSNGVQSLARFGERRHAADAPGPGGDREAWLRRSRRATLGYWAVAATVGTLAVVTALG